MCPVKTETISFNVPREEGRFWRKLAFDATNRGEARSRGDLQKNLLMAGLEKFSPERAGQLREIRRRYYGAALLLIFCATIFGHENLRVARRPVRGRDLEVETAPA